jgi:hypothetical protein
MGYYQEIVAEHLKSSRTIFVNPEALIDLGNQAKGRHWWVDVLAADFNKRTIFLCAKTLSALIKRLKCWSDKWDEFEAAVFAATHAPREWRVVPWVFIPKQLLPVYQKGLAGLGALRFTPLYSCLEKTPPWVPFEYGSPISGINAPGETPSGIRGPDPSGWV